jgi:hypothetical protein
MKNTLAENMLRFAPKNLNAIDIKRLLQLVEQEVAAATGGAYKTDPMFKELYSKLGNQAKLYWDGKKKSKTGQVMTDVDRDKLLAAFKQKIAEAIPRRGKDQNKVLKKLEYVAIGTKPGETTQIIQATPPAPTLAVYTSVYPNNQKQNPELQNFFLTDNVVEVSPENEVGFKTMIADLVSNIPTDETITKIEVYAGSSTSQVPTTYGMAPGTKYKTIQEGQQNNVALANKRYDVIVSKLAELVKQQVPQFKGQIIIAPKTAETVKPNNGPAYTEKERSFYFGGSTDGKVVPEKKSQYDTTYGPFKGSYGGVTIYTESQSIPTPTPVKETQVTTDWYLTTKFKSKPDFSIGLPIPGRAKGGGGTIYKGKARTTCPLW